VWLIINLIIVSLQIDLDHRRNNLRVEENKLFDSIRRKLKAQRKNYFGKYLQFANSESASKRFSGCHQARREGG